MFKMRMPSQEAFDKWAFPNGEEKPNPNVAVMEASYKPDKYSDPQIALLWYAWQSGRNFGYEQAIDFVASGE